MIYIINILRGLKMSENNLTYKSYGLLTAFFYTFLFVNDVVLYKLVSIFSIKISAASLIFPATYLVIDIITELYGYELTKRLIWESTVLNIIFSVLIGGLLQLPSPNDWTLSTAFSEVFRNIAVISIIHAVIAPLSYFVNAYILSKWKIMTHGKYFWFRSINSSLIGELIFSIMMACFIWHGHTTSFIIELTIATYASKFIWSILGAYPAAIIVNRLKLAEHTDAFDYSVRFNPFKFKK